MPGKTRPSSSKRVDTPYTVTPRFTPDGTSTCDVGHEEEPGESSSPTQAFHVHHVSCVGREQGGRQAGGGVDVILSRTLEGKHLPACLPACAPLPGRLLPPSSLRIERLITQAIAFDSLVTYLPMSSASNSARMPCITLSLGITTATVRSGVPILSAAEVSSFARRPPTAETFRRAWHR